MNERERSKILLKCQMPKLKDRNRHALMPRMARLDKYSRSPFKQMQELYWASRAREVHLRVLASHPLK